MQYRRTDDGTDGTDTDRWRDGTDGMYYQYGWDGGTVQTGQMHGRTDGDGRDKRTDRRDGWDGQPDRTDGQMDGPDERNGQTDGQLGVRTDSSGRGSTRLTRPSLAHQAQLGWPSKLRQHSNQSVSNMLTLLTRLGWLTSEDTSKRCPGSQVTQNHEKLVIFSARAIAENSEEWPWLQRVPSEQSGRF